VARSSYIYVVTQEDGTVSPFTVKYEAQDYVESLLEDAYGTNITQYRDGGGLVKQWNVEDFLGHPAK
jgi:hypothetical protein